MSEPIAARRTRRLPRMIPIGVLLVVLLAVPLWLSDFWLQVGLFAMAYVVGAIGLTLLVGTAGQLSLAHSFFVAVGAYGYSYLVAEPDSGGDLAGLGLPPAVAMVLAVLAGGLAGALFSPIASRLRGIYLGLASIGLVFLCRHLLLNIESITGGYNGRNAAPFAVPGFSFSNDDPVNLKFLGFRVDQLERLWLLFVPLAFLSAWFAVNVQAGRPGRALRNLRDSEVAAAVMGVSVVRAKATIFTLSSMYAAFAGVLMALAFGRIVPESFGLTMSIDFLVMIVIGGLGSVHGAAIGAVFVTALPLVLTRYTGSLPFLAEPGSPGFGAPHLSRTLYGVAIIVVLLYARGGLAGLLDRLVPARRSHSDGAGDGAPTPTGPDRHSHPDSSVRAETSAGSFPTSNTASPLEKEIAQ